MTLADGRSLQVHIDDVLTNDVLVAGPEQHETKQTKLTVQERFFVDVHNVFMHRQKLKEEARLSKSDTAAADDDAAKKSESRDVPSSASAASVAQEQAFPLADVEQLVNMARFQLDTLVSLVDTVMAHKQLTIAQAQPPVSRLSPQAKHAQVVSHMASRKQLLMDVSCMLGGGANTVRSSSTISSKYASQLGCISSFWRIGKFGNAALGVTGVPSRLAVQCSLKRSSKVHQIPLYRRPDGQIAPVPSAMLPGAEFASLQPTAQLAQLQMSLLYRQLMDYLSSSEELAHVSGRVIGGKIVWFDGGSSVSISCPQDAPMSIVGSRGPDSFTADALVCRLLSDLISDDRDQSIQSLSSRCSIKSQKGAASTLSSLSLVKKITSHIRTRERVLKGVKAVVTQGDGRLLIQTADSPIHLGFKVYFRERFVCEGTISGSVIRMNCSGATVDIALPQHSYHVICQTPSHVERVLRHALSTAQGN